VGDLAQDFASVWQERHVTGALDGACQLALMLAASPCLAAWADLAVVSDKATQLLGLLVIYGSTLVGAELAFAGAGEEASPTGLGFVACRLVSHLVLLSGKIL
jgi:hypothetical protein